MDGSEAGPARGEVRFLLNGQLVCESALPRTMTVLEYLREVRGRTGTKEGCAEGDCGACTVVEGTLSADGSRIRYRAINACIRFMATLDGHELVTVEDLQAPDGTLHPVQQSMVDHHGSQCGFCTPGFVMSLFGLYLEGGPASRERVIHCLTGNLCRCTGYRPIIDAGIAMHDYPAPRDWSAAAPCDAPRRQALAALATAGPLRLPGFYAPRTVAQLAAELAEQPQSLVLAGGTDVGLWVTKQLRELPPIVYVGAVESLQQIERTAAGLRIGAAVSLTDAWQALVGVCPALAEVADRFASPPVRNSGTLCGNLANGSPIGDGLPTLIALGAEIELRCAERTRWLALEKFYLGYQKKDLAPGEFVVSVRVPAPAANTRVGVFKLSKRIDQDISAVCLACAVSVEGERIVAARVALGGMAAVAARAPAAEQTLLGQPWSQASFEAAAVSLAQDFEPLSDMRASSRLPPGRRRQPAAPLLPLLCLRCAAAHRGRFGVSAGEAPRHDSAHLHVSGRAEYADDIPLPAGTLHAAFGMSSIAHGRVTRLDLGPVRSAAGVVAVVAAQDVPGDNNYGSAVQDDPIFAPGLVQHVGQPLFAVAADSYRNARRAALAAVVEFEPLPAILDIRAALAAQSRVLPTHTLVRGRYRGGMARARTGSAARWGWAARTTSISRARSPRPFPRRTGACWCTARPSTPRRCSRSLPTRSACRPARSPCSAAAWAAGSAARRPSPH